MSLHYPSAPLISWQGMHQSGVLAAGSLFPAQCALAGNSKSAASTATVSTPQTNEVLVQEQLQKQVVRVQVSPVTIRRFLERYLMYLLDAQFHSYRTLLCTFTPIHCADCPPKMC